MRVWKRRNGMDDEGDGKITDKREGWQAVR